MSSTKDAQQELHERLAEEGYKYRVVALFVITVVHIFLYGSYVLLFRIADVVLRRRAQANTNAPHRLFRLAVVSLFALSSISVPLSLAYDFLYIKNMYWFAAGWGDQTFEPLWLHLGWVSM
ncbi:hypothetical protein V5O48_015447, partial [Marasmius crinis-equi]